MSSKRSLNVAMAPFQKHIKSMLKHIRKALKRAGVWGGKQRRILKELLDEVDSPKEMRKMMANSTRGRYGATTLSAKWERQLLAAKAAAEAAYGREIPGLD